MVDVAMKHFVQRFLLGHIGKYCQYKLVGAIFSALSTLPMPVIKRSERVFLTPICGASSEHLEYLQLLSCATVRQSYSQMCTSNRISGFITATSNWAHDAGNGGGSSGPAIGKPVAICGLARVRHH